MPIGTLAPVTVPAGPPVDPAHRPSSTTKAASSSRLRRRSVEANARLTGLAAAVLFVLLAAEGYTVLNVHSLLTPHVVIGMILVPVVLVKLGSTLWRFLHYYRGDLAYREKGPPPVLLRLLGPFVVVLTLAVLGTGIVLLLVPTGQRSEWLFLHKATFILWLAAMTIHVLGHLVDTAELTWRDLSRRTRKQVRGAGAREWLLVAALASGILLAFAIAPKIGNWHLGGGADGVQAPPPAGAPAGPGSGLRR